MKQFTKADMERRDESVNALTDAWAEVEEAKGAFQEAIARINEKIDAYNEALNDAQGWLEDIVSTAQSYYDDRSEKWQEGDSGSAYQDWISAMEDIAFDEIEHVREEDLGLPDEPDTASELDEMPTEPSE